MLIIENDTVRIDSNPLEEYFKKKGKRTIGNLEMHGSCTALWRGYVATWKLENDSLFLIRIQTDYCEKDRTEIDISKEFKSNKVFAKWVNSPIIKPEGEMLQYVHMGYMSIFEGETFYFFNKGKLTCKETNNYLEVDQNLVFPGTTFLRDTLTTIIYRSVDPFMRKFFNVDDFCSLFIAFDREGRVSEIGLNYGKEPKTIMEKTLVHKAKESLKNLPRLMKVNHERYSPPRIDIIFNGYCLKFPHDREYGCKYE